MPKLWAGAEPKAQFTHFVSQSGQNGQQKLEELGHNILDHGGTKQIITMFDSKKNKIDVTQLDKIESKYLLQEDNVVGGFTNGIDDLSRMFTGENHAGIGFYRLGFIAFLSNDVSVCYIISVNKVIKVTLPLNDVPHFYEETELNKEDENILEPFNISLKNTAVGSKIFCVLKESSCFTKEDIYNLSKLNDMDSYYDNTKLPNHIYSYFTINDTFLYKKVATLYYKSIDGKIIGHRNIDGGESYETLNTIKQYKPDSMVSKTNKVGNFDMKINCKMCFVPKDKEPEDDNKIKRRIDYVYANERRCTLKEGDEVDSLIKKLIKGFNPRNNPWKRLEVTLELHIINENIKHALYNFLGMCSQKNKAQPLHERKEIVTNLRWCVQQEIINNFDKNYDKWNGNNRIVNQNNEWYSTGSDSEKLWPPESVADDPEPVIPETVDPEPVIPETVDPEPVIPEHVDPVNPVGPVHVKEHKRGKLDPEGKKIHIMLLKKRINEIERDPNTEVERDEHNLMKRVTGFIN